MPDARGPEQRTTDTRRQGAGRCGLRGEGYGGEIRAALELEKGTALTKPIQDYLFAFDRLCYGDGPCRFIKPSGSLRELFCQPAFH
jgi:hypothetical protein